MKAAFKYELASAAGVSSRTFQRWLSDNKEELARLGVRSTRSQLLPPKAVRWICQEYGIDLPI